MLTHREILSELRRIGIKEPSMLKTYLKDFELYMQVNHGSDFGKMKGAMQGITDLNSLSAIEPIERKENRVGKEISIFEEQRLGQK